MPTLTTLKSRYLVALALMAIGCQPALSPQQMEATGEGLFLTRYMSTKVHTRVYQLSQPALLERVSIKDNKYEINRDLLEQVEQEQTQFLEEVKKQAPEAQLVYRYRLTLNALAISGTYEEHDKLAQISQVQQIETANKLELIREVTDDYAVAVSDSNSVKLIGAETAHKLGITGKNVRVGVVDSGIDYTHRMLGGPGTEESYLSINPEKPSPLFPNEKIVGGIDLMGDITSINVMTRDNFIPYPDQNPLDENGHGTHIAGTIAGIGDNENSHTGVAPDAKIYAIKAVTRDGETYDYVLLKALEYAADPNEDLDLSDKLDVLNFSLGTIFGVPYTMMNTAIDNLRKVGTFVVAAVGNSGNIPFVAASPAVNTNTISVAASFFADVMKNTIQFSTATDRFYLYYRDISNLIIGEWLDSAKGELAYWNISDSSQNLEAFRNKVVLFQGDRQNDSDRIAQLAKAGAVGVLLITPDGNTEDFRSKRYFQMPGGILLQSEADKLLKELSHETIEVDFISSKKAQMRMHTMANFSSRGPRSTDGQIKPEITAPGVNILSAVVATGDVVDYQDGTSMATPHIAGVMALLLEKHPHRSLDFYKSLLMGQAEPILQSDGTPFPIALQGAGQVNVLKSLDASLISTPAALSLGIHKLNSSKKLKTELELQNISDETLNLRYSFVGSKSLVLNGGSLTLAAGKSKKIQINSLLDVKSVQSDSADLEGRILFKDQSGQLLLQIPVLALVKKESQLKIQSLEESYSLENPQTQSVYANLFQALGHSSQKPQAPEKLIQDSGCDLKSVGYRVVERNAAKILQLAYETYDMQTTWNKCETSIQFDLNQDGIVDFEATNHVHLIPGIYESQLTSLLFDGNKVRQIQKDYLAKESQNDYAEFDYLNAVTDTRLFTGLSLSRYAILEINLDKLSLQEAQPVQVKISTSHQSNGSVQQDDYLQDQNTWFQPNWDLSKITFAQEEIKLEGRQTLEIPKPASSGYLVIKTAASLRENDSSVENERKTSDLLPRRRGER